MMKSDKDGLIDAYMIARDGMARMKRQEARHTLHVRLMVVVAALVLACALVVMVL
jgi:hypothetical protein